MPDLNDLLLFIAIVSPLVVLGRTAKRGAAHREWRGPALVVLLVTAAAWLLVRPIAGLLGGSAWLLLLFIPAFA